MVIKYDEYALLELFCSEPIVIERDAEIFQYQKNDSFGFKLTIYFSAYDQSATVSLEHEHLERPLYDIALKHVTAIRANKNKLSIYLSNEEKVIEISFEPNFIMDIYV